MMVGGPHAVQPGHPSAYNSMSANQRGMHMGLFIQNSKGSNGHFNQNGVASATAVSGLKFSNQPVSAKDVLSFSNSTQQGLFPKI